MNVLQTNEMLFDNYVDPICIISLDDKVIRVNKSFEKLFGYEQDELIGKDFPGHTGYDNGILPYWIDQCRNGKGVPSYISNRKNSKNQELSLSISVSPIYDSSDELTAMSISYRDVTELVKSKNELQYYYNIMQNLNDAIIATDTSLKITMWNNAAENIYGWNAEEAKGQDIDLLLNTVFLDTTQEIAQQELIQNGVWKGLVSQNTKNNEDLIIEATVGWIRDVDSNIIGGVTVNRDVTQLIENERKIRQDEIEKQSILDSMPDYITLQNLDNTIIWANKKVLDKHNITIDKIIGMSCYEFWGTNKLFCNNCAVEKVKSTNKPISIEIKSVDAREWIVKASPIFDSEGNLIKILEVAEDITERKENIRKLAESENKYRSLIDTAPVAITIFNNNSLVYTNPEGLKILGIEGDVNDILQIQKIDNPEKYLNQEDYSRLMCIRQDLLDDKINEVSTTFKINGLDGHIRFIFATISSFILDNEKYFQVVAIDKTDLINLTETQRNLAAESLYMREKNKSVELMIEKFLEICKRNQIKKEDKMQFLKLSSNFFNPEKEWQVTKAHFEAVYHDFFKNLKSAFPVLTQYDLRHCAYIKLSHSTKEIARLLGVEPTSVQKSRVRLKKKLNLSKSDDLYGFIMNF